MREKINEIQMLTGHNYRVFNVGSPINIPAGHNANLEAITAHYNKMHKETEERQQKRAAERKE